MTLIIIYLIKNTLLTNYHCFYHGDYKIEYLLFYNPYLKYLLSYS